MMTQSSPQPPYRILVIDSSRFPLRAEVDVLVPLLKEGSTIRLAENLTSARVELMEHPFDLVLATVDQDVEHLRIIIPDLPLFCVCRKLETKSVKDKFNLPEASIIALPTPFDSIAQAIERRIEAARSTRIDSDPLTDLHASCNSAKWRAVLHEAEEGAYSDIRILLTGPSGTGKTTLAQQIHRHSMRSTGPFQTVTLVGMPKDLQFSELFGHEKGAYTGSDRKRLGAFQKAYGGTLFLDEVGELIPDTQAALLRALQNRMVKPLGADSEVPVNVRILSATNRDLFADVLKGKFREDLWYRLVTAVIRLPSLAERPDDIIPLAHKFVNNFALKNNKGPLVLSSEVEGWILAYPWPGNVRELEQFVECGVAFLSPGETCLEMRHFLNSVPMYSKTMPPVEPQCPGIGEHTRASYLEISERHYYRTLLKRFGNDHKAMARFAGFDQWRTVKDHMEKLGLLTPGEHP